MSKVMQVETLSIVLPYLPAEEVTECTFCLIRFTGDVLENNVMVRSIHRRKFRRPSSEEAREYFRLRPEFTQANFVLALTERVEWIFDDGSYWLFRTLLRDDITGELIESLQENAGGWIPQLIYLLAVIPKAR